MKIKLAILALVILTLACSPAEPKTGGKEAPELVAQQRLVCRGAGQVCILDSGMNR